MSLSFTSTVQTLSLSHLMKLALLIGTQRKTCTSTTWLYGTLHPGLVDARRCALSGWTGCVRWYLDPGRAVARRQTRTAPPFIRWQCCLATMCPPTGCSTPFTKRFAQPDVLAEHMQICRQEDMHGAFKRQPAAANVSVAHPWVGMLVCKRGCADQIGWLCTTHVAVLQLISQH